MTEIPVRIEHKIDPFTQKPRTVIQGIATDQFLSAELRGHHGNPGLAALTIGPGKSTKKIVANNVILAEEGSTAIYVGGEAQGLDVVGNILIHDEKFVEIIKGLIQREDEAFKRGYDTGLEAGRRAKAYPCMVE